MSLQLSTRPLVVLALGLAVLLAGCSGFQPGDGGLSPADLSAEEIGEQIQQKYEEIDTYTATVTTEMSMGNGSQTTTANVWVNQSSGEMRYEYVEPSSQAGTVVVSNGSTTWHYDESANTVRKMDLGGLGDLGGAGAAMNYGRMVENVVENFDVSFDGTATVDDRETYVLSLTPKGNATGLAAMGNQTLWVDQGSWFPVKQRATASFADQSVEVTTTYTDLTLDADVPAERFEFEPPANATVTGTDLPDTARYDSIAAAERNVSLDLVEPGSVPDGYELERVTTTDADEYTTAALIYGNGTDRLRVGQSTRAGGVGVPADAENVTVAGTEGTYSELGANGVVRWSCGDRGLTVSGPLSKDELLTVAGSLACS